MSKNWSLVPNQCSPEGAASFGSLVPSTVRWLKSVGVTHGASSAIARNSAVISSPATSSHRASPVVSRNGASIRATVPERRFAISTSPSGPPSR
jgi:hypothetical protein